MKIRRFWLSGLGLVVLSGVLWILALKANMLTREVQPLRPRSFELLGASSFDISLPRGVVGQAGELTVVNSNDPELVTDGYLILASVLHDFPGSFWKGPRGSLRVTITLNRTAADYEMTVQSAEDLRRYMQWLVVSRNVSRGCEISQVEVKGMPIVVTKWSKDEVVDAGRLRSNTVYSFLVGRGLFVEVASKIIPWGDGRGGGDTWVSQAEALEEEILQSITLRASR
jgi:hypothetical protein